jgi:hypothetical protein
MHSAVGKAITAFSTVELLLCNHLALVTQMQPHMAKAVFFSARSLRGRLDMIQDAIAAAGDVVGYPSYMPFLKVALNRAGQWAATRNMLAHANVSFVDYGQSKYCGQAILWDSSVSDWPDPKRVLTLTELEDAFTNFGRLSLLLLTAYSRGKALEETKLKECHALVVQLPTQATSPEQRRMFLKRMSKLIPDGEHKFHLP